MSVSVNQTANVEKLFKSGGLRRVPTTHLSKPLLRQKYIVAEPFRHCGNFLDTPFHTMVQAVRLKDF